MGWLSFFGCGFTAYGPILTLFFATVATNAQYVILAMTSAFFWLISLLIVSIFWFTIPGLRDLPPVVITYAIIIQELFRLGFYWLFAKAEKGLNAVSDNSNSQFNRPIFAYGMFFVCLH